MKMQLSYIEYFLVKNFGLSALDIVDIFSEHVDLQYTKLLFSLKSLLLSFQSLHVLFKNISLVFDLLEHDLDYVLELGIDWVFLLIVV